MRVSVVIRTRDKESHFDPLLENLTLQTFQTSEIIVVDNFSTERKLRILERDLQEIKRKRFKYQQIKLIPISNGEFSHAYSTNLGVNAAENELVCITNAHSLPISLSWLQDGLRHFQDPKVAGVSGFFIPYRQANVFGKFDRAMYYFSQKMILRQDWCSTINCIIRKSLWKSYPFDENLPEMIPETRKYGLEDYDWSKEMMTRGFKIVIDPLFSVFHSHGRGLNEISRNVKGYFVYRKIQQKINLFTRPRRSFSKVFHTRNLTPTTVKISF